MDLNALELFVAVAEANSFSTAAKTLSVPKSTVSRGLARLEAELQLTLVNRTTRKVSLSTAGQALYERVAPLLRSLKKTLGELPEQEEQPSGHLRVTAAVDFGEAILPELVTQFVARYPGVRVEVKLTNRLVDLVGEQVDLAFRAAAERLNDSALVGRKAGALSLQLFAAPAYLARRGQVRSPEELGAHELVVFRKAGPVTLTADSQVATVTFAGRLVADDLFFNREAARAGAGIALLPTFLVERDLLAGTLERVLPRWGARSGAMWVVTPPGQLPRRTVAFRDFAVEWLKAHPLAS